MEIKNLVTGFLVLALFVISLVSFGVNFGNENDASILITDNNSAIKTIYTGVNDTIYNYGGGGLYETANESFSAFNEGSGTTGILSSISEFFIKGILKVGEGIMGIGNAIFNVTFSPILKGLGVPNEIATIIGIIVSIILLFSLILMAWKLYRQG